MALISSHEILLDNQRFHFAIYPFEMKNSLGKVIALLQEYVITSCDSGSEQCSYRLYKTKEGNWYEIEFENSKADKIIRQLKYAINSIEADFESVLL